MDEVTPHLPVDKVWEPIPSADWNEGAARHLLLRTGFSADNDAIAKALSQPVDVVVKGLFERPPPLPSTRTIREIIDRLAGHAQRMRSADASERKRLRAELRELERTGYEEFGLAWIQRAADQRHSAYEKLVLFLQDVFVVAFSKVRNPALLHAHQELLRDRGAGSYIELCKAVSRSPAMIVYLDLQQSRAGRPNENFARELFELFTLGEGNYSEEDIKEAARAFTGYRQNAGRFVFQRRAFDPGVKRVFGKKGAYSGDHVIDLVFDQPAAASFLPRELIRFYLTDRPVPDVHPQALGRFWRNQHFNTGSLLRRFFTSRFFFDPSFRGDMIKSPVQFYLGLLQDLKLDVAPFPRLTLGSLRQMGQPFFNPPNVRGWVGGQHWINSSTLAARRQLVEWLLSPLDESRLNGDELAALASSRSDGRARFTVRNPDRLVSGADRLQALVAGRPGAGILQQIEKGLRSPGAEVANGRHVLSAVLQSPHYQLC